MSAEVGHRLADLLLAEIGVVYPLALDLGDDVGRPHASADALGAFGPLIQCFETAISFLEPALPEEEGAAFDREGVHRGLDPVFLPEGKDSGFVLGFVGEHMRPP